MFTLEPLPHDLHVQQPQVPDAEPETERPRHLGFVAERAVVEPQLLEGITQIVEGVAVDGVQPAEDHRFRLQVAGQRLRGRARRLGDGLARSSLSHVLDAGDEIPHLAGTERRGRRVLRPSTAHLEGLVGHPGLHEPELGARPHLTVHHPDRTDHTAVLIEMGVEDERLQRFVDLADGGRDAVDHGIEEFADALAGLGRDAQDLIGGNAEHLLDLRRVHVRLGGGEVDLVEAGDDLEVVLEGQVTVGEGLGLDALAGVDHEDHAFAGGERPRDLVAEIDVARSVDQVDHVVAVVEPHRLELDGDAALALEVHRIEVLGAHLPGVDGAADLEDAVGQGGLAVVDVGDDRQVADS